MAQMTVEVVGKQFVRKYYKMCSDEPENLYRFYQVRGESTRPPKGRVGSRGRRRRRTTHAPREGRLRGARRRLASGLAGSGAPAQRPRPRHGTRPHHP